MTKSKASRQRPRICRHEINRLSHTEASGACVTAHRLLKYEALIGQIHSVDTRIRRTYLTKLWQNKRRKSGSIPHFLFFSFSFFKKRLGDNVYIR